MLCTNTLLNFNKLKDCFYSTIRFRAGVKDLEVMVQNLITVAFETVTTVEEGVDLLEVFSSFSARESIKRAIDRKTAEVSYSFTFISTKHVYKNIALFEKI